MSPWTNPQSVIQLKSLVCSSSAGPDGCLHKVRRGRGKSRVAGEAGLEHRGPADPQARGHHARRGHPRGTVGITGRLGWFSRPDLYCRGLRTLKQVIDSSMCKQRIYSGPWSKECVCFRIISSRNSSLKKGPVCVKTYDHFVFLKHGHMHNSNYQRGCKLE